MTFPRHKLIAASVTLLVYALMVALLFMLSLKRTIQPDREEGLFVNFGTIDAAAGLFEPETAPQPEPVTEAPSETAAEPLITQDMETSIALAEKKEEEAKRKLEAEQQRKAEAIRRQTASVFSKTSGSTESQGSAATGTGNQGVANGTPEATSTVGGGQGYGNFSLDGRNIDGALPRPSYTIQEEGVVVVRIVVNPRGSVVSADIQLRGTTTDSPSLRSAALSAAKQARFNDIAGSNNQSGTITYRFKLR